MDEFLAKPFTREAVNRILQQISLSSVPFEDTTASRDTIDVLINNNGDDEDLKRQAREHLRTVYPLDDQQLTELLDESVRSVKFSIQEASEAMALDEFEVLESVAHKMKGTFMGLGLDVQIEIAKVLYITAKNNDIEEYSSVF